MEIRNPGSSTTRPSQDVAISTNSSTNDEDDHFGGRESSIKSYTCAFCKRGFSNAQALGGHMNVHRRDRARLQEQNQETLITATKPPMTLDSFEAQSLSSDDEKTGDQGVAKAPWINLIEENSDPVPREKDDGGLQLSLCIAPSSTTSDHSSIKPNKISEAPTEVDLELRLGIDPDQKPSS